MTHFIKPVVVYLPSVLHLHKVGFASLPVKIEAIFRHFKYIVWNLLIRLRIFVIQSNFELHGTSKKLFQNRKITIIWGSVRCSYITNYDYSEPKKLPWTLCIKSAFRRFWKEVITQLKVRLLLSYNYNSLLVIQPVMW